MGTFVNIEKYKIDDPWTYYRVEPDNTPEEPYFFIGINPRGTKILFFKNKSLTKVEGIVDLTSDEPIDIKWLSSKSIYAVVVQVSKALKLDHLPDSISFYS
jgi:hypothetical protein